jgi:hypothetical protein
VFRAPPTTPTLLARVGKGIAFEDASRNDGSDVYNRVLVEYTDPRGNDSVEERTTAALTGAFATPPIVFDTNSPPFTNGTFENDTIGVLPASWTAAAGTFLCQATPDTGTKAGQATTDAGGAGGCTSASISGLILGRTYTLQYRIQRRAAWAAGTLIANVTYAGTSAFVVSETLTTALAAGSYTTKTLQFTARQTSIQFSIANTAGLSASVAIFDLDNVVLEVALPTIVDRQGFVRTFVLSTGVATTQAAAQQIGDTFLQAHRTTPLRGSLTVAGPALERIDGTPLPPHLISRHIGDGILITEQDPDSGAVGRLGLIAAATYTHETDSCTVTIDTRRDFLDSILSRFSVFQGA